MSMNPYEVLMALDVASGSTAKVRILKENDDDWVRGVMKSACDPLITYGVKKYKFTDEPAGHTDFEHNFQYASVLLNELQRRSITGNNAQTSITKASKFLNEEQRYVLSCILDKDLHCGVSTGTVNKAFKGLIPVWKIQKANKMNWDKVTYPCIAEVKENGRGNTVIIEGTEIKHYSTNGRENNNMSVFDKELKGIASGCPMVIFGEVRGRKGKGVEQFKSSQSYGGKDADMTDAVFVIWDMMLLGEFRRQVCARPQVQRSRRLKDHVRTYQINHDTDKSFKVRYVKQWPIKSQAALEHLFARALRSGLEGLIVKNLDAPYEFKRGNNWMKLKEGHTFDLKVVGVKQGKGKLKGHLGSVTVLNGKVKVDCPMGKGVDRAESLRLWLMYKEDKKSIVGRIAEVSCQNVTPDGSLFLPKFLMIRDDKTKADKIVGAIDTPTKTVAVLKVRKKKRKKKR